MQLSGSVTVRNEVGEEVRSHNLVVYSGGDIIGRLLAGYTQYKLSHMYFAYENTAGTPSPISPARTDSVNSFLALTAPRDFVKGAVFSPIPLTAGDANHVSNVATVTAAASASTGLVSSLPFSAAANSKVYALGLVASPTGILAEDVLYAIFSLPTALPVVGAGLVSATWATEAD